MSLNGASRVVLIVEDEWFLREIIAAAFRRAGWQVLEARTAENAINLIPGPRVDLVFTDIQLAGNLCGWDVAEKFRAARTSLPIIYASGGASVEHSRRVPGSLFFQKPYNTDAVVEACDKLMAA